MITLNAAKILGIDDRLGSLEVGKDATLFIAEGDTRHANQPTQPRFYPRKRNWLETHQTELWKRYMEKFSQSML